VTIDRLAQIEPSQFVAIAVGLCAAGLVATARRAVHPPSRSIDRVRAALHTHPLVASSAGTGHGRRSSRVITERIVAPFVPGVHRRLESGLDIIGRSAAEVAARVVVAAIGVFGSVLALLTAFVGLGVVPVSVWWIVLAVVAGAGAGWIMWSDTIESIAGARRDFARATNDFVQLVAVGLTTDQSVEAAITFASSVGGGTAFDTIRGHLAAAPARGLAVWDALTELGDRYDQRELRELAASIERQGTHGVSITDTVTSLAAAMRAGALDELERAADKANANLAGPTVAFVVTTVVFLAYPLAIRISTAFGG
jgi:Flp pilus assembly protein TadB